MDPGSLPPQRAAFEIPDDVCYLNCAYMSPQLAAAREAGAAALALKARPWTLSDEHWFGRVEEARRAFGELIGARADDVALVPSASYGLGTAAQNVPVARGQTIVLLAEQFPSCVYPWRRRAEDEDASIVTVARPADGDWTPAVVDAIDERCAVAALPQFHWTDGAAVDLVAVGARLREVGARLVLDLSQSAGAAPFDVADVDPDFVCAATYKWLLGPYSCGFLYAAPRCQQGRPLEENWIARAASERFGTLADYRDDYRDGARRYDVGERSNFVLVPMVLAGLRQLAEWRVDRIASTLRGTTLRIAEIAARHGFEALRPAVRAPHILGLTRAGGLPDDLLERLAAESVHVGRRGRALRVAPHVHVTDDDLARFDAALARALS